LHPFAQSLLREFEDVFPNDLPSELPPLRGIKHQIDLLSGGPLPNKPAYWCNPNESKKLKRKVQQLRDHEYIKKSLSPCLVPTLLVSEKDGAWCMCVNSRAISNITIKYIFPIPPIG